MEVVGIVVKECDVREVDRSILGATKWSDRSEPAGTAYLVLRPFRAVESRSSSNLADPQTEVCGTDADLTQLGTYCW